MMIVTKEEDYLQFFKSSLGYSIFFLQKTMENFDTCHVSEGTIFLVYLLCQLDKWLQNVNNMYVLNS